MSEESLRKIDDYFNHDYKRHERKNEVEKFYKEKGEELKIYFKKRKEMLSNNSLNHGDFNLSNFLVLNNKIEKIFDFDEMVIAPVEYEIAIAIYYLDYPQEFYLDHLIEIFLKKYYSNIEEINLQKIEDIIMFIKYRAFYRFARYFSYYQFTQNPGGHFSKFQDIYNRLGELDSKQILKFVQAE